MKTRLLIGSVGILCAVLFVFIGCTQERQNKPEATGPSIEGTFKLVSRQLQDGTMQGAPDVMGMFTYTKSYRNFNVIWKDSKGKSFSYSLVSNYKLTEAEYSETLLFSVMNDQIGGKEIVYDMSGQTKTAPVSMASGGIEFKMPFDPVSFVFKGDSVVATAEGQFVDTWKKVE